jgi:hypothetical protein
VTGRELCPTDTWAEPTESSLAFVAVVRWGSVKRGARSRLIVKLTLCTLAGAVITWAVAWGCALWGPPLPPFGALIKPTEQELDHLPVGWSRQVRGVERAEAYRIFRTFTSRERAGDVSLRVQPTETTRELQIETYGWPFRSMIRVRATDTGAVPIPPILAIRPPNLPPLLPRPPPPPPPPPPPCNGVGADSISAPAILLPGPGCTGLPTKVMLKGFALSTLLFSSPLLGCMMFRTLVAWGRRHGRRCPWCGYDRGGLASEAKCPECGRVAVGNAK